MIPAVIPFYKHKEQLDRCIKHLHEQDMPIDIFIRDNSEDNIYFTAAVNEGIKMFLNRIGWNYLIIINQHTYLMPNALCEMVKFMTTHPKCGIGMPIHINEQERDYVNFGGGCQAFPMGFAFVGNISRFRNNEKIIWASGACLILKREMIQEIGLLDENMLFVGSDSDYCFTARSRGWQVWRIGGAQVIHEKAESGKTSSLEINLIKANDMLNFAEKWLTGGLYRKMSHEKENCDTDRVEKELNHLKGERDKLNAILRLADDAQKGRISDAETKEKVEGILLRS